MCTSRQALDRQTQSERKQPKSLEIKFSQAWPYFPTAPGREVHPTRQMTSLAFEASAAVLEIICDKPQPLRSLLSVFHL